MTPVARHRRLILLVAIGLAVFVIGVVAASLRLPEWRNRTVPGRGFFAARVQEAARHAGLEIEAAPRIQLSSHGWIHEFEELGGRDTTYAVLGSKAADWLASQGRGPFIETTARSRWAAGGDTGEIRLLFSTRGVPVSAIWIADDPFRTVSAVEQTRRREALLHVFAPGMTSAGRTEVGMLGERLHLVPLPGTSPPESVLEVSVTGGVFPFAQRMVGSVDEWRRRLEGVTFGSLIRTRLPSTVVEGVFVLTTIAVFVLLLARRRIELAKGAILGAVSIALSVPGPILSAVAWFQLVDVLFDIVARGVALFVLWSAAESWVRSTIPGFRTSLDALRAGRLGPAAGTALLAGWSFGAAAAGLWLMAFVASTFVPGLIPTDASIRMPMFGLSASPIDEGAMRTGIVLLAICAALRWPVVRRIRGSATVLAALVLATRLPLTPFWIALAVGLLVAIVLVRSYASFGLTALLAAAVTSAVLPSALFSLLHVAWLPWSALLLVAAAAAPLVFGAIGLTRREEVELGPMPVPAFVRRLEEESRLKYEMDLLARMQLGLLPQETPRVEGYEIAARSVLANEAGGDLYDFLPDANGRIWIAAGDVSGHGYSCAIAQAMTKAGLASLVEADRTPAFVLDRLDRVLRGSGSSRTFTSLALMRLDPVAGEAVVSNAGHPYPWIVRDGDARELELPSLPLGQGPVRQYTDAPLAIEPGTALVFLSDGVFEAHDANGRAYGFDRIRDLLARICRRSAEAIVTAILEDWRAYIGSAPPADDTTVVVVKRV